MVEWRLVEEFPMYEVSSEGGIRNRKTKVKKYVRRHKGGYGQCTFKGSRASKETRTKIRSLHRIVATAFIPNPENKPCLNHIDHNPSNNAVSNLEWATHKENTAHCIAAGRMTVLSIKGANRVGAKLTEEQVRYVYRTKESISIRRMAKELGVSPGAISGIRQGRNWKHLTQINKNLTDLET